MYLWAGPHGSHASRAAHSLHGTQVRMAWMRGKNNTTWGPAEREPVLCRCECTSRTLWSCRVHVGQHGMRTWTSPWWLIGKQHKDWWKGQFYMNMTWCAWGVYMDATHTWLAILMGGPLGPPANRGDMKDCDKKHRGSMRFCSMNVHKFKGKFVGMLKTRQSTELRWMPKHEAPALRTSVPIWMHRSK